MNRPGRNAFARRPRLAGFLVAAVLMAGCGTSSGGSSTAPPTTSQPTVAAETAFADWTARQGFGGSSGLHNVDKLTAWLGDHEADVTLFDLDGDAQDIANLATWLDTHQPTACWSAYHEAVRADLTKLAAYYVTTRAAVAAGGPAPADVVANMETTSKAALGMPAPASCP